MTIEDIALVMTPGIGIKGAIRLLETFGDAQHIFAASADELIGEAQLRANLAQQLVHRTGFSAAERELTHCRRHGITAIASTDTEYPALLRETTDYPHMIYIKGDQSALTKRCISIVGTREPTPNGETMCNRIVEGLAERIPRLCIVSGLAYGIDVAAHRAALVAGVPTVGVLPNSLPSVMPTQHTDVARDMLDNGGVLVTELHSQSKQTGNFYLARNRIIAGLSAGTVVIESGIDGGSLFTAHCADGYNRTVMALPGRTSDKMSAGTNQLIRNRKALLVRSAADIAFDLQWELGLEEHEIRQKPATPQLTLSEKALLGHFKSEDPQPFGELQTRSGLNPGELATLLIGLELSGAIRQLPGNCYIKLV